MLGGLLSRQEAEDEERLLLLREAEQQQHQQHANNAAVVSRSNDDNVILDSLAGSSIIPSKSNQYGSLGSIDAHENNLAGVEEESDQYADEYDEDHSDLEGEYSYDDDHDHDDDLDYEQGSNWRKSLRRIGSKIRSAVVAIADVDNVWDSPDAANLHHVHSGGAYAEDPDGNTDQNQATRIMYNVIAGGTSTRNRTAAIFWFIFLSTSYAAERSTFKLLVDRVGPFRLFSAELILGAHALLTGLGILMGSMLGRKKKKEFEWPEGGGSGLGLPLADVGRKYSH